MDRLCGEGSGKMPGFGTWKDAKENRDEMQCNTDEVVLGTYGMTKL